ncbi:MAG: hypothetical protein HY814_00260 [Candidatus Riflebacteria bacterium]|nr:hypothetical protein [Candidatus Riflebacteria bacterium]
MVILAEEANRLIEGLALEYRGEVTLRMGPVSPYPEMAFYHARRQATLDLVTTSGQERVNLTLTPDPKTVSRLFDLRLFPPRELDPFLGWLRIRDRRVQEALQAGMFRLHTSDLGLLRNYFSEAATFRIRELAGIERQRQLAMAWTPGRFLVQKPVARFRLEEVHRIVELSLGILGCLQDGGIQSRGDDREIRFVPVLLADQVRLDPTGGACRVCGERLGPLVVACATCSTLHHPDCWQYTGRCSIYACGGTRSIERKRG